MYFGCDCCGGTFTARQVVEINIRGSIKWRCHGCLSKGKSAVRALAEVVVRGRMGQSLGEIALFVTKKAEKYGVPLRKKR